MNAREVSKGEGAAAEYALLLAATALRGEPFADVFADLPDWLHRWREQRGAQAAALLVTVVTDQSRTEDARPVLAQICRADPGVVAFVSGLQEATLIFGTAAGAEVQRVDLRWAILAPHARSTERLELPGGVELRVALGPVLVDSRILARGVARFVHGVYSDLWVEAWTGRQWLSHGTGLPAVEQCMLSAPVSPEWLASRQPPIPSWPPGYAPKPAP